VDISSGYDASTMSYDGLHPNGEGEYEIADAFATALANDYGLGSVPGAPPPSVPGIAMTTPTSVSASISQTGVLLQWSHVYGATGYKILERDITFNPSPLPAFTELPIPLPGDHWNAGWGAPAHTYQYEIKASRGSDESGASSPVTLTMPAPEPTADAPTDVTVTPSAGSTSITLSWVRPFGGANDNSIDGYTVYWLDADAGCPNQIPSDAKATGTSYTITGLVPGHLYDLAIASNNAAGTGAWQGDPAAIVGYGAPAAPVLSAASSDQLSWTTPAGATGYWIYETSPAPPFTWTRLPLEVPAAWAGIVNPDLYEITAANGTLESPMSNSVLLPPPAQTPSSSGPAAGSSSPLNAGAWMPAWATAAPNELLLPSSYTINPG
jgi:hypothetical protein